ncbi:MAG: hypothetical protein KGS72_14340 [Cyanobacteria bacterium REEB67]|nr:hypothetical protein [Cyanobacteria bacterium REEB67]
MTRNHFHFLAQATLGLAAVGFVISDAPALADPAAAPIAAAAATTGTAEASSTAPAAGEKPVLDPGKYFGKAKAGYQAAKEAPEICAKLFCYCGCDLTDDHSSLLDCFTSDHGVDCYICQEEALVALKMKQQGKSLAEIQKVVDLAYTKEYPWDENSPAYKKYLAAKLWQGSARAELDKTRSQGDASSAKDLVKGKPTSSSGKTSGGATGASMNAKSKTSTAAPLSAADAAKRATKGSCCGHHPSK